MTQVGLVLTSCDLVTRDGERVWVTSNFLTAVATGANRFEHNFAATPYFTRLQKYRQRGFAVDVPGLDTLAFGGNVNGHFARMEATADAAAVVTDDEGEASTESNYQVTASRAALFLPDSSF